MNDRVARHFAEAAKQHENVELLRVDDSTGKTDVSLSERCKRANNFGADFYLSIHHNAGVDLTTAGGIEAYSYVGSKSGVAYRDAVYNACIAAGGIRGNRAEPKKGGTFYVLKNTAMPAVLMEYGFMDSTKDAPIILTEEYSKKMAYATMDAIAEVAGLKKKAQPEKSGIVYRVQVGCFSNKDNADNLKKVLKKAGYDAFVVKSGG